MADQEICPDSTDYTKSVGKVTITARADIGVDWVLTPGEEASVEVLGQDLNWKSDRMMIIDCTGICGISGPTASISSGPMKQRQFNHWVAEKPVFVDPPHDDDEVPGSRPPPAEPVEYFWRTEAGQYCAGNNMDVTEAVVGDAYRHQCYEKCVVNAPCEGDGCFCDGLLQGYDDADCQALCLDKDACMLTCEALDDCYGIDMHTTKNRCFLNRMTAGEEDKGSCQEYITNGQLTKFATYDFYYKQTSTGRRMDTPAPARSLLPQKDSGASWDEILRFNNITFSTGGQFKACFCDPDTLGDAYCKSEKDYKIEIGTIHVSGVSCLIENPKFQRGTCVEQFHGGLRCYSGTAPTLTIPAAAQVQATIQHAAVDDEPNDVISAFCLYGPEEETRENPLCD